MTRMTLLSLCVASLLLTACGGDYEANPIVIQDGSKTIVIDDHNDAADTGITLDQFSQTQLTVLQANIWQTSCMNGQIIELTFSKTDRTASLFQYSDTNCNTLATGTVQMSIAPYTVYEKVQDPSGLDMTRIEFRSLLTHTTIITRTVFAIEQNRLYLGKAGNNSLAFSRELNFNRPFYAIPSSDSITIPDTFTISIPTEDFVIIN